MNNVDTNDNNKIFNVLSKYTYRSDLHILFAKIGNRNVILKNATSIKFIEEIYNKKDYNKTLNNIAYYYGIKKEKIKKDFDDFIDFLLKDFLNNFTFQREGLPSEIDLEKINFPLSIEVEITRRCNWNCKFCYNTWKHSDEYPNTLDLSYDKFKNIINESLENGCTSLKISGGEPTLHPKFNNFIEYASEMGMNISLFTNGTLLDENMISFLKNNKISTVLISLHGLQNQHELYTNIYNSYNKTIRTIENLIKNNIQVSVETILSASSTIKEIIEMGNILTTIGVKHWNFMPYVSTGSTYDSKYQYNIKQLPQLMEELYKKYNIDIRVVCSQKLCLNTSKLSLDDLNQNKYIDGNCGAGILWISISYNGKIRNCPHSDIYAGTIEEGLKKIYLTKLKPHILNIYNNLDECKHCLGYKECRGGCHLNKIKNY